MYETENTSNMVQHTRLVIIPISVLQTLKHELVVLAMDWLSKADLSPCPSYYRQDIQLLLRPPNRNQEALQIRRHSLPSESS